MYTIRHAKVKEYVGNMHMVDSIIVTFLEIEISS